MDGAMRKTRGRPRGAAGEAGSVQTLERALSLLSLLSRSEKATLTELALRAGVPPSSAHRLLTTLQAARYVEFDEPTGDWSVGVEAFRAGAAFLRRTRVAEAGREAMRALVEQTGESANLAVPDGPEVVFVGQVETAQPVRAFFAPGMRAHMHASGIGKALLAAMGRAAAERLLLKSGLPEFTPKTLTSPQALFDDLEAIRARGWSLDDEERYLGMRCVAAPVWNHHGEAVAGVSISGPAARLSPEATAAFGPLVRRAAASITERIGGAPPATGWGA